MRLADGLVHGGDYNPEPWPRETWLEEMELMREAGVNLVTLGVFSWGLLETADGVFDFGWLDEIVELLHANGIGIDLATPTAAPPGWLHTAHPEILPRLADLYQEPPGGRNAWCPSSPVFRFYALRIAEQLAQRYGQHPAVRLWHVGNELGGGNARYSSDALLKHYRAEREVIRRFSDRPVTTNLMVGPGAQVVDHARWAPHTDIAATDHYTLVDDPDRAIELACAGDRMRGISAVPARGGTLLVTYLSGICEPTGRVRTGGYPGAFRDVLGAWSDEFHPLQAGEEVLLDDGGLVRDWTERVFLDGAQSVLSYAGGSLAGSPAVTRRAVGSGAAWYVSAALPESSIETITERLIAEAGLPRTVVAPPGPEAVRRIGPDASYLFLINHRDETVDVETAGVNLLTDEKLGPTASVPAGKVMVVRENPTVFHTTTPGRAL